MNSNGRKPPVVILADGEFPTRPALLDIMREAEMILCCDGAAEKLLQWGRVPDYVIGDLDSISPAAASRCRGKLFPIAEQESNDLAKVFRFCRERGIAPDYLLGAAGGREDHFLGNLGQFIKFFPFFPSLKWMTERGFFCGVQGKATFSHLPVGMQISLFSCTQEAKITASGLKYPLVSRQLLCWDEGTLNEIVSPEISVEIEKNGKIILFFCENRKRCR